MENKHRQEEVLRVDGSGDSWYQTRKPCFHLLYFHWNLQLWSLEFFLTFILFCIFFLNLLFCNSVNLLVYFLDNAILCTKKRCYSIINFISETQIFFLSFHYLKFFFLLLSLENKFKLYSWNMNYFKVNQALIYLPNFLSVASPSIL